uniref:Zinc finger protein ZPR1-like protein n=1 Tax=Cucumis melo TaxID=3656 RepID=A0A9I9E5U5_CUCME
MNRSNHGRTRLLYRSSLIIIIAGQSRFYNDSMSSLSKKENRSIFLNLLHNQMLELQSQPIPEGNQLRSGDEIWETMLGRRSGYSNGLGWGPKLKARKTTSASSSTTSCPQSTVELQLQAKLDQAMQRIEEHTRNHEALVSEVEQMRKLIEDMTRAQQVPPHDDP